MYYCIVYVYNLTLYNSFALLLHWQGHDEAQEDTEQNGDLAE